MLQQDIAEELERERKRNKKELAALRHTNNTLTRQRDESQRVVLHLRSLIDGQTHHMEHIVRSLNEAPELSNYIAEGYEDGPDDMDEHASVPGGESLGASKRLSHLKNEARHSYSRASTLDDETKVEGEHVTPEMENHFFDSLLSEKKGSRLSLTDVADRHLRDKTDAIADIIRNISEQCAAAVEGLQLAHDAEHDDDLLDGKKIHDDHLAPSEDGQDQSVRTDGSEMGEIEESSFLSPRNHNSSIPPTPDLVHNRSSTSMSMVSSALESDRSSQHYGHAQADIGTKIMQHGEEDERGSEVGTGHIETGKGKMNDPVDRLARPLTARLVQ